MKAFILLLWLTAFFGSQLFSQLPPMSMWHVLAIAVAVMYVLFAFLCARNARNYPQRVAVGEDA